MCSLLISGIQISFAREKKKIKEFIKISGKYWIIPHGKKIIDCIDSENFEIDPMKAQLSK